MKGVFVLVLLATCLFVSLVSSETITQVAYLLVVCFYCLRLFGSAVLTQRMLEDFARINTKFIRSQTRTFVLVKNVLLVT